MFFFLLLNSAFFGSLITCIQNHDMDFACFWRESNPRCRGPRKILIHILYPTFTKSNIHKEMVARFETWVQAEEGPSEGPNLRVSAGEQV